MKLGLLWFTKVLIGLYIAYLFTMGFMGKFDWFIGFNNAREIIFNPNGMSLTRAKFGIFVVYGMAIASVILIIVPREWTLIFFGFFLALVTFVVLLAF